MAVRMTMYRWLEKEFVSLSAEGHAKFPADEGVADLLRRFDGELQGVGLSLDHTVRTRLWAKDRPSRDTGSNERVKLLAGRARSASSSYIAPTYFDSDGCVGLDLLAMRPSRPGVEKILREYDPPIVPLRYLVYETSVVLSGVTAVLPTLADQVADILPRISASLDDAGTSWQDVGKVSCFLHRSQTVAALKDLLPDWINKIPEVEYAFVDGYSSEGKLLEVEVTATSSPLSHRPLQGG